VVLVVVGLLTDQVYFVCLCADYSLCRALCKFVECCLVTLICMISKYYFGRLELELKAYVLDSMVFGLGMPCGVFNLGRG
jgi:hypothetical protein